MADAATVLKSLGQWSREALPIARWLPDYGLDQARGDMMAGLTVGVVLIPQGMAYAVLTGVPPIYGLYASVIPLFVYPLFATSRHMAAGVTAVHLIVVAAGVSAFAEAGTPEYVGLAIVTTILVGILQIAMGAARLGFLANLLSRPVISGFTAAAAIIIALSQLGALLGIDVPHSARVHVLVGDVLARIEGVHGPSVAIGLGGIALVIGLQRWKELFPGELTLVVVATLAAWALGLGGRGVELVGEVPRGLPSVSFPEFELAMLPQLWKVVLTVALVQFMSVVSLGRIFATKHRYSIDPNQELVGVGASNLVGGFFQSIPVAGSFSRTAVNERAGAETPLANVVAAALVVVILLFLTPLLTFLPMPALAAIIMVAAVGLFDLGEIRYLFRAKPSDGWVAAVTFGATLFIGIEEGILIGVTMAILAVLYRISRPYVAELGHLPATQSFRNLERFTDSTPIEGILVLRVEAGFSFFNAEFFKDFILHESVSGERERIRAVIIDGKSINFMDTTAVSAMAEVVRTLRDWNIDIYFTGLTGPVRDVIESSGLGDWLGEDHFFMNPHYAVEHILEKWDEAGHTDRLEEYREAQEQELEEVEPTKEEKFT